MMSSVSCFPLDRAKLHFRSVGHQRTLLEASRGDRVKYNKTETGFPAYGVTRENRNLDDEIAFHDGYAPIRDQMNG